MMVKNIFYMVVFIIIMVSCSGSTDSIPATVQLQTYKHSVEELELMQEVNKYRSSRGLNQLLILDHISYLSAQHNKIMIEKNLVSHNGFTGRSNELIQLYNALNVGENVAYNYKSNKGVMYAWINSFIHKKNIEGDFTHFGLSISKDSISDKKYYTNIFIKEHL